VFLLPTAQRSLRPDMVAFIGLGAFDTFTEEVLRIAARTPSARWCWAASAMWRPC
jgi:hypothetical protein